MIYQYSIEQVPENLDKIIKEVEQGDSVQITRQQERVAVILSGAEYDHLLQSKPGFGKALEKFRQELIEEGIEIDERGGISWSARSLERA